MPLEPELEAIFNLDPRFKEVLAEYERNGTSNPDRPLQVDGVTDEALQAYLDRFYTPRNPAFRSGEGAPPPRGGMEDQLGDSQPGGPPSPPAATSPPAPGPETGGSPAPAGPAPTSAPSPGAGGDQPVGGPDQPPAGSPPAPTGDPFRSPEGIDPARLAAFREFDEQLKSDPRLQRILFHYATEGVVPDDLARPPASPYPRSSGPAVGVPSAPAAGPDLTPPPDLDLADPSVKTVWDRFVASEQARFQQADELMRRIAELNERVDTTAMAFQERTAAENEGLVARVRNSFAREHGLEPEEAARLQRVAENMGVAEHYMRYGTDPITMQPVRPDPMAACQRAFEIALTVDPIAKAREEARMQAAVQARTQIEAERRRKLAGVGGGSGQAPRTAPDPANMTREERTSAMTEWLRGHMNGTPQGAQE